MNKKQRKRKIHPNFTWNKISIILYVVLTKILPKWKIKYWNNIDTCYYNIDDMIIVKEK